MGQEGIMKREYKKPKVNSLIAALLETEKEDMAVTLEGYVGPSNSSTLRLYLDLGVTHYIDVPDESVLQIEDLHESGDGRVRVWVKGSSEIRTVTIGKAAPHTAQFSRSLGRIGPSFGGGGLFPFPIPPRECFLECQQVYDHCLRTNPFLERDPKICDEIWAACMRECMRRRRPGVVA
jgi:hypothetical protein